MSRLEKLTVVLFAETSFENEIIVGSQRFERPEPQSIVRTYMIFEKVVDVWPDLSGNDALKRTDGSLVSVSELSSRLKLGQQWGGPLEFGGIVIHVAELPSKMQVIITVEETMPGAARPWGKWVEKFLCEQAFVQAWVADIEYDYWQNATDPLEYEAAGRSYKDLPMKSNDLPFPLQQDIIDTKQNLARMEIKHGYVEAIGSQLWVSALFWHNSGGSLEKLHNLSDDFTLYSVDCGVTEVVYLDRHFDSNETADAQMQLRKNLYGTV